ncbi:MAG: hypothetical protein ACE5I3_01765 [Phycisphaerae bacterium]
MKLKFKMALLGLSAGMIALQFTNCARFWGDFAGDKFFLGFWD